MTPIVSDRCREARKTLMLYRDNLTAYPVNMNGCFDHALNCHNCYSWAAKNGLQEKIRKYADDKLRQLKCPICDQPMKVNMDFRIAKCFHCDWELCWIDPIRLGMSIVRLGEIIHGKRGDFERIFGTMPFL